MMRMIAAGAAALWAGAAAAEDPAFGRWLTPEGDAVVEIGPCGQAACGWIVALREDVAPAGAPLQDGRNPDPDLRGRPICGLRMIEGLRRAGPGEWVDGRLYNSRNGRTYTGRIAVGPDGRLTLRGYVGLPIFGESQVWSRAGEGAPREC
ncbi:MAG: DUF2147 domain-containing protein [Rubrimonas sp.]